MNEVTPTPEFEQKVLAASSAPAPDSQFVQRLRAQITASARAKTAAADSASSPVKPSHPKPMQHRGTLPMRTRYLFPALAAVILIAVAAFFAIHPPSPVSAQQIIERATAAQSAAAASRSASNGTSQGASQGIWHTRFEEYKNMQALPGERPGTTTTTDDYYNSATGFDRRVTIDAAGKVVEASSVDSAYTYSTYGPVSGAAVIYRTPVSQEDVQKRLGTPDPYSWKAFFDQFNNNPRVTVEGKIKWIDGSPAYVLVNHSYQTQKGVNGQDNKTLTSTMRVIFSAETYRLLESTTSVRKDGKDIIIESVRYLVDEVLPQGSLVAWDLSDLKDVTIADAAQPQPEEVHIEKLTVQELAQHDQAYMLKTLPTGYTVEIVAVANQPKDQPYHYEVNYSGPNGIIFGLMAVGANDPGFVETAFYDGSYKTASGLELNYSPSGSAAMLVTPGANSYLVTYRGLTREQVQALVEDLAPIQ